MQTLDEDPGKLAAWLLRVVVDVWTDEGIRKDLAHIMAVVCLECVTTQTNQCMQQSQQHQEDSVFFNVRTSGQHYSRRSTAVFHSRALVI